MSKKIISLKWANIIWDYYTLNGTEKTLYHFNLQPESLEEYLTDIKIYYSDEIPDVLNMNNIVNVIENIGNDNVHEPCTKVKSEQEIKIRDKILNQIGEKYSEEDLKIILNIPNLSNHKIEPAYPSFEGEHLKIGIISDSHIGSIYFMEKWWDAALREFDKENVNFICHAGDLVEGLNDRHPGHMYELTHIGYDEQKMYAIELLNKSSKDVFLIDGNHDRWYRKSNGASIVKDISRTVEHCKFLGHDEGDIILKCGVKIKLWHGEDGNSYALSYRLQKIIESLTVGEEPHLLITGHVHKALYLPTERGIHAIAAGALCKQSAWMRGKKIANHSGFWILDLITGENSILSCNAKFYQLK